MKNHRRDQLAHVFVLGYIVAMAPLGALGCGAPAEGDIEEVTGAVSPPSDPRFRDQWALRNTGQDLPPEEGLADLTGVAGIDVNVLKAWDVTQGAPSVIVAIIDQQLTDLTHPDLVANLFVNPGESGAKAHNHIDDDHNGFVDDVSGFDFVADGTTSPGEHATRMAGILAAQLGNGLGIVGVAPKVRFLPLRANANSDDQMTRAIAYAKMMGAKIVSISQGGLDSEGYNRPAVRQAMQSSGLLFVCSAGNLGCLGQTGLCRGNADLNYPSSYDIPNIISVANIDSQGELAPGSFYGETNVDIAAPGTGIVSTIPGGDYNIRNGTSEGTPLVAGVAALVATRFPTLDTTGIINRILGTGMRITLLDRLVKTGAMLDANAAVNDIPPITLGARSEPGKITLSWTPVSRATRYLVERDGTQVDAGNNTTFVHANLVVDSPHFYRVRALVNGTYGPWSHRFMKRASQESTVQAYSLESLHPYVRDDFHVSQRNAKLLRVHFQQVATAPGDELAWEIPNFDDQSTVSYKGSYPNGFWSNWIKDDRFDFSLQGSGTQPAFGFRIDKIEFVATIPDKPDAPQLNDSGPNSVTVGFSSTGGSNLVDVYRSTAAFGGYVRIASVDAALSEYLDQPVDRSRTFYYRVSCVNDFGESPQSDFLKVPAL